jgi:CRP-like cAMP-binding protein
MRDGEVLRTVGPGEGFGEVALLRETTRTASVQAIDRMELWVLRREHFTTAVQGCSRSAAEAESLLRSMRFVPAGPRTPHPGR